MPPTRKETQSYHFSVEGATEKWYLEWLQAEINKQPQSIYKITIHSKIENPKSYVKKVKVIGVDRLEITHVFDYESNDEEHIKKFRGMLDLLKESTQQGKKVNYNLGYTNFTFELWMILHKAECNTQLNYRKQYLKLINNGFDENFASLDQCKNEMNFKRVLSKLSISDVKEAIKRSKGIMKRNEENGLALQQYKGYEYYRENPSLSLWE